MATETRKAKIHTYCKFCKALGIKRVATHMTKYAPAFSMRDTYKHYACIDHIDLMEDTDPSRTRSQLIKDMKSNKQLSEDHLTEADYQTWMKL